MGDRLRPLWDFDDLDATEGRFRAQLELETADAGRAEVLTQLARVEGLRGRFEECDALLDDAEALGGAEARVLLERGRRERSSGQPGAGLAQFEQAFERAQADGETVSAVDAAHMLAIVDDGEAWTTRGVEIASQSDDPEVRYWLGPLYNNLGWSRYDAGDAAGALEAFELALAAREQDDSRPHEIEIARYTVGKALRSLGRVDEAAAAHEQCVAWADEAGVDDTYFHEELAEDYAALGPRRRGARAGPRGPRGRSRGRLPARAPSARARRCSLGAGPLVSAQVVVELVTGNEAGPDPAGDGLELAVADECASLVLGAVELGRDLADRQRFGPVRAVAAHVSPVK